MEQHPAKATRRPRSDSLRNRERLIAAAREVFGQGNATASLESVARTAGVGIGTLYRHFPTRDALFQAVYRQEVDELVDLATTLAADGDAVDALRRWLHANIRVVATKRGMLAALAPSPDSSRALFADSRTRLVAAIESLMHRAQSAGILRRDVGSEDVLVTLYGICYAQDGPGWQAKATRLVDVFMAGLATRE